MIDSKRTADTFSERLIRFKQDLERATMTSEKARDLKSKIEAHLKK